MPVFFVNNYVERRFVGDFAHLQKATVSFMSVRMEEIGSRWTDIQEISYLNIFRKSVEGIQISLRHDKNSGKFTRRPKYIYYILPSSHENEKCLRQNLSTKSNTHFVLSNVSFENRAVYKIMWKNVLELGRPHMTTWRTDIACSIPKATNTHLECVILIDFPLQQWLYERASMLRHSYIACLVSHCCQVTSSTCRTTSNLQGGDTLSSRHVSSCDVTRTVGM